MTNKEIYYQLCETEGDNIPLFQQYWWMETVCAGKRWDVLLCKEHGRLLGAMPYHYGRKLGMKYILQPQLTPWCGPWIDPSLDTDSRQFALNVLAVALRRQKAVLCMQRFSPGNTDWQPFQMQGFRHLSHYTYRFDPLPEPLRLESLADRGRRRGVEEVRKAYSIDRTVKPEEFVTLHLEYWNRRGGHDLLSRDLIQRVCSVTLDRGQALLYGLRDKEGILQAARFAVFDSHCAYALMSAMRPESLRNSMTFLVWTMLADLQGHTAAFDFEGGMAPGVGHFYGSFGAKQTELPCIYRTRIPFGKKLLHL